MINVAYNFLEEVSYYLYIPTDQLAGFLAFRRTRRHSQAPRTLSLTIHACFRHWLAFIVRLGRSDYREAVTTKKSHDRMNTSKVRLSAVIFAIITFGSVGTSSAIFLGWSGSQTRALVNSYNSDSSDGHVIFWIMAFFGGGGFLLYQALKKK